MVLIVEEATNHLNPYSSIVLFIFISMWDKLTSIIFLANLSRMGKLYIKKIQKNKNS